MHSSGLDPRPDIAKWSKATFRYIVLIFLTSRPLERRLLGSQVWCG